MNILFIIALILQFTAILCGTAYMCQDSSSNGSYKKGDQIVVCVFYISSVNSDTGVSRMAYTVEVDKFTALLAPGAFTALSPSGAVNLQANSGNTATQYNVQYITSGGNAFPMNSIVIQMTKGNIVDVFWDNVCFNVGTCENGGVDGTTGDGLQNDQITCSTPTDCDPTVYVSFVGSDSQGQYFTSGGLRMSQFQAYNTASIYQSAQNTFYSTISQ